MADATFGKYRLLAELGHGGMADVFLAVVAGPAGSGFSKLTVIKRLRQNLAEDPEFVAMLVDEARIAARLNHPNVVQTNEVGAVDHQYFIAMEYLDGQPLHRVQFRVAKETTETAPTVTKEMQYLVVVDALAGLHHAHDLSDYDNTPLQIVHRDVTPHNIFVTYEGQVKVVDFGIAKATGRASETRQGVVKGKVRYMAPEQAIGQSLDHRADIFSMGIILWEVVTGRRMWKDKDDLAIVQSLVAGEIPASPRSIDPSVPEALDKICQKALAYAPTDRYATATEMAADLEQYLADNNLLVAARRKLGPAVGELFKDKRAEIKQVIERQLSALSNRTSMNELRPAFIALESSSSPTPSSKAVTVSLADETKSAKTAATATVTDQAPTERYDRGAKKGAARIGRLVIPAALVASLLGVGAWTATHREGTGATSSSGAAANIDHATTTTANNLVVEQTEVLLKVDPPNAVIKLDDHVVEANVVARLPHDGKQHRVEVSAEGFTTKTDVLTFDSNKVERQFTLEKATPATTNPSSSKGVTSPVAARPITRPNQNVANNPAAPATPNATPASTEPPVSTAPASPTGSARRKREIDKSDPWGGPTP